MNDFQRNRADTLRHYRTILSRWAGASARMTELTASHRTLKIELTKRDQQGRLAVACIDPDFIHGPMDWTGAQLVVELAEQDGYILRDDTADLRVRAGKIELKEYA